MSSNSKLLGFGMMRLPRKFASTDVSQVSQMVDEYLEAGFNYFDTAFVYPGSEVAMRKALVSRHPRESFYVATKLNGAICPTLGVAKKQFETSLERTQARYVDYYLLHNITRGNYARYDKLGLWDYVLDLRKQGLVKHVGFSFHDHPDLLEHLLKAHPEIEFVQLQINYADWNDPSIESRANYEVARAFDKPVIVMEPVKGGRLTNLPSDVAALFEKTSPGFSPASWAIRFAASLDGVISVLSGMSDISQMRDNLSYMVDFQPLDDAEQKAIREAQRMLGSSNAIPCTSCGYCLDGCPARIAIPDVIEALNKRISNGQEAEALRAYGDAVAGGGSAGECIGCSACEETCPQHLPIVVHLEEAAALFERDC